MQQGSSDHKWRAVYALVIGFLLISILMLYMFTRHFA